MGNVLTQHTCAAKAAYDMVGIKLGPHQILMYYQTALKLAAGILQSSKLAGRYDGVHPAGWAEHVAHRLIPQIPTELQNLEYRRSKAEPNFKVWKVGFDKNLVVFTFDEAVIKMHFEDAFEMYGQVRLAGKNAKRWAGDTGKQWSTRAHLVDAEENDKFVYAK